MIHFYTDATGNVGFADHCPDGMLTVFRARTMKRAREIAEVVCRHAHDGDALIVAPVRDAFIEEPEDWRAAVDALKAFRAWIAPNKGVYI